MPANIIGKVICTRRAIAMSMDRIIDTPRTTSMFNDNLKRLMKLRRLLQI